MESKKRPLEEIDKEIDEVDKRLKTLEDERNAHPDRILPSFYKCDSLPTFLAHTLVKEGRLTAFEPSLEQDYDHNKENWSCTIKLDGMASTYSASRKIYWDEDDEDEQKESWDVPIAVDKLKKLRPSKRWEWLQKRYDARGLAWQLTWMYFFDTVYFSDE